jgi:ABC-type multidrug transport system ATPase subunit
MARMERVYHVFRRILIVRQGETVEDAIDQFVKRFGYQPDRVFVKGNQVRIERRDEK